MKMEVAELAQGWEECCPWGCVGVDDCASSRRGEAGASHLEDALHPHGELLELAFNIVRDVRLTTSETATK